MFDAIVCDPPYGVRAGARRTGTHKEVAPPSAPSIYATPSRADAGGVAAPRDQPPSGEIQEAFLNTSLENAFSEDVTYVC